MHCAKVGAVAEMRHHCASAGAFRGDFAQASGDEFKGKTMKTVAADSVLIEASRTRKTADRRREAVMERGVEAADLRQSWPQR